MIAQKASRQSSNSSDIVTSAADKTTVSISDRNKPKDKLHMLVSAIGK
jgi:hypothetical protein